MLAESLLEQGELELATANIDAAAKTLGNAYWTAMESRHDDVAATAASLRMLALAQSDRYDEGAEWSRHAASVVKRIGGGGEVEARYRFNLGSMLSEQNRPKEALVELERALDIQRGRLGDDHPRVANTIEEIGLARWRLGDTDGAFARYEEAMAIREKTLGPDHPLNSWTLNRIGITYKELDRYEEARRAYERAIDLSERAFGPNHLTAARAFNNLGNLTDDNDQYREAKDYYSRALAIYEQSHGPEHTDVARALSNLGVVLENLEDYEQSLATHERALAIREKVLGPESLDVATSLNNLAEVHAKMGQPERALELHTRAYGIRVRFGSPGDANLAWTIAQIVETYASLGRRDDAVELLETAIARYEGSQGVPPEHRARARFLLADLLWEQRSQRTRAIELARTARDEYVSAGTKFGKRVTAIDAWLGDHSASIE